eukprot:scaffold316361_cov25-Prasinocladus_malaysianus.AAC.1
MRMVTAPRESVTVTKPGSRMEDVLQDLLSDAKDLQHATVQGRRVLVRADLNVPLEDGPHGRPQVADDN